MNVYYRSPDWSVTIQRPDYTSTTLYYKLVPEWGYYDRVRFVSSSEKAGDATAHTDLISYEYSNSIKDPTGSFSMTFVPRMDSNSYTWKDKIRRRDIVTIKEFDKVRYMGVVRSTGYTMSMSGGNPSRAIKVSGMSLGGLLADYSVVMNLFLWPQASGDAQTNNEKLVDALNSIVEEDGDLGKTFELIKERFFTVMLGSTTSGFKPIFEEYFDLSIDDLKAKYPMNIQPFQVGENNLWTIFSQILPQPVYEMFGRFEDGKYKLHCRETPFDLNPWNALTESVIDPVYLVSQDLNDSDEEVFTHYFSQTPNSSFSEAEIYADNAINEVSVFDYDLLPIFGYRQLQATFPFLNLDKTKEFNSREFLKYNSARLYAWYRNNADFQSGSVTLMTVPDSDNNYPDIGEKMKYLQGDEGKIYFYIEGVKREMNYPATMTSTYELTRGFEYGSDVVSIGGERLDTPQVRPITSLGKKLMDTEKDIVKEAG